MKKISFLLLFFACITKCFSEKCTITYHIRNYPNFKFIDFIGEGAGVIYFSDQKGIKKDDTFSVEILEPTSIVVATSHSDHNKVKSFWINDGNIDITIDSTGNIVFKNSPLNDEYLLIKHFSDSMIQFLQPLWIEKYSNKSWSDYQHDSLTKAIDSINLITANHSYNIHLKNPKSFLALDFLRFYIAQEKLDQEKLKKLFNSLDTSLQKYPTYKNCIEVLALNHKKYNESDTIDYLPLTDKNGKQIDFKLLLNGKYIYIDNWASGCSGCWPNNKMLVKAFKKLKKKVEFIGVSSDTNKESWLRAIKKMKIKWKNFCDLKGTLSIPDILLNCSFTPNGMFISPTGKIIKKDMYSTGSVEQFIEEIKELMKR